MAKHPGSLLVSTGEPSGRLYARLLETALLELDPTIAIHRLDPGPARAPVFGFAEGLRAAPRLWRSLAADRRRIAELNPDLVLLVGFSNYNLLLGRHCRRAGRPVAFFGPPQLWAWGGWRVGALRRAADLVICLFGFEAEWFKTVGIRAEFFGNPLVDAVACSNDRPTVLEILGLDPTDRYIALLPGSRPAEQEWHRRVYERIEPFEHHPVTVLLDESCPAEAERSARRRYDIIAHADAAVVVSGTATLETALLGIPQVSCYHLSPFTRLIARLLVGSRPFALPNILLGRPTVPELLEPSPGLIAAELRGILTDPSRKERALQNASALRRLLGPPGSARRIARRLFEL